jgi:hypothetical protein
LAPSCDTADPCVCDQVCVDVLLLGPVDHIGLLGGVTGGVGGVTGGVGGVTGGVVHCIVTGKLDVLFARIGSKVDADTCAALLMVPAWVACTVIERNTDVFTGICGIFHVYVLPTTLAPVAATIANQTGNVSVNTIPVAISGQLLVIIKLYVNVSHMDAVFILAFFSSDKSAPTAATLVSVQSKLSCGLS